MFTAGGGPGEVHSYFSPYESPMDAFAVAHALLLDFETRLRLATLTANEPFLFHRSMGAENFTGVMSWSLKGFAKALKTVDAKALEFHTRRGDFESWAEHSLRDKELARALSKAREKKLAGETLRKALVDVAVERFKELSKQTQSATRLF
jgi:alpha-amylase